MGKRENFTAGRVASLTCPEGKQQAIYWDGKQAGLGLRVTRTGARAYVFESRLHGKTLRTTIGDPSAWTIDAARREAARLKVMLDTGINPAEQRREQAQAAAAAAQQKREDTRRRELSVGDAWTAYLEERRPHWSDLHHRDHIRKASPGGAVSRRKGAQNEKTEPGPLYVFMALPLAELTADRIEAWAAREGQQRPTSARLAWRLLNAFTVWCSEQPQYAAILPTATPARTKRTREALGRPRVKDDVLLREQLPVWFQHARSMMNPVIGAYLQTLLLTGARPGEVLGLEWADVDLRWNALTLRDKATRAERVIPLTPYVKTLLRALPRRNDWVFSSVRTDGGRIAPPNEPHSRLCAAAGLERLTLHGLRRSYSTLTEWLDVPAGIVAQLQGHKPSATAERHYKRRPLDLLRVHADRIEAWMLEQAGIAFTAPAEDDARLRMA